MNNFVFGNGDPLLYGNTLSRPEYSNEQDLKKQLDTVMMQYQQLQQNKQDSNQKDWIGDFDNFLKGLDTDVANELSNDKEFAQLNAALQQDIQNEIMLSIKWKLNGKQDVVYKIKRLSEIADSFNKNKMSKDKQQMAEIADYMQNYSDMTFNEYKKMKESK